MSGGAAASSRNREPIGSADAGAPVSNADIAPIFEEVAGLPKLRDEKPFRIRLSRERQTRRLLRAMEHRCFTVLAHPLGRLIGEREGIDVYLPAVIAAARRRGCCLELNAQAQRMDLADVYCREARELGVPIAVNSDAHRREDFANLRYGVGQARRGWLEKGDVLNTRPLAELRKVLDGLRRKGGGT
jgi:DNA polymerase (family 10)